MLLTVDKYTDGYEPSITVDTYDNVWVTAHKQNHSLVVSPDARSTLGVRSQSWLWVSKDGKTFTDPAGLTPLQEQNMEFGDEGDLARDDTGHVYFVDTNVTDNSFSRYKSSGNGHVKLETTRPVGPFGEPVDDRPWIAAHGDGVVMYVGNQGDKATYPAGATGDSDAYGPGRYTVYMSSTCCSPSGEGFRWPRSTTASVRPAAQPASRFSPDCGYSPQVRNVLAISGTSRSLRS